MPYSTKALPSILASLKLSSEISILSMCPPVLLLYLTIRFIDYKVHSIYCQTWRVRMFNLRSYQKKLICDIYAAFKRVRAVLAVLATGGGKTVVFSKIIHDHVGASAAIVHRKEIVSQISCSLAALKVKHRVIAPAKVITLIRRKHLKKYGASYVDPNSKVGVISVQTLTSKSSEKDYLIQAWVAQVTLAVFDEGHHYVATGIWSKAVLAMASAKLLFVTATPTRADGQGLGDNASGFVQEMIEAEDNQALISAGYLSRFKYIAPSSDLDTTDIPITAIGELSAKILRERVVDSSLVGDVVEHYKNLAEGKKCIVFASDVKTAFELEKKFKSGRVRAKALSGETAPDERDKAVNDFENKKLKVLINVNLFDEGFDVAAAEVCIIARPTQSLAKFMQMIGRVLRVVYPENSDLSSVSSRINARDNGSKPFALIIDPVRNWERHGLPNWPRVWSLDDNDKSQRSAQEIDPLRVCTHCTQPYEAYRIECPYCGKPPVMLDRKTPLSVAGDLRELDLDSMTQLFEKIRHANCSDEVYREYQIARRIPFIGRRRDLLRHQDNKASRADLRELVERWMTSQPSNRTPSEKQKRFYCRFKIDIGTAFTLKAKDTDLLVLKIKDNFNKDLT